MPARLRSRPLTNSQSCLAMPRRRRDSITSSSTRLRRDTRFACLKLPAAWTGFIATNTTGTSCLGPLAGLETQKSLYDASLNALTDPSDNDADSGQPARAVRARGGEPVRELSWRNGRRKSDDFF